MIGTFIGLALASHGGEIQFSPYEPKSKSLAAKPFAIFGQILPSHSTGDATKLPKAIPAKGMENVFQLNEKIYSGSAPEGEEGFAQLQKLGIKTIISVDGSRPDVDLAHKHGFRYVHLPHGYDGINAQVQAQLVKAAQTAEGPVFVHCHHGKHRGPTAAAVICMAGGGWSPAQGEAWLKAAGTATNYTGLFDVVRHFKAPSKEALAGISPDFPEAAKVSGLVDAMVVIDETWDRLKSVRKAQYQSPKDHPDIIPAKEALILMEHFREAQRLPESARHGTPFLERLKSPEIGLLEAEKLLQQLASTPTLETRQQLDRTFDAIGQSCVSCHKSFRDRAEKSSAK